MFNNYAIVQGVDQVVPVDVYAPGCPPTPETLIHAIETLHQLIENGELLKRRAGDRRRRRRARHRDPGGAQPVPVSSRCAEPCPTPPSGAAAAPEPADAPRRARCVERARPAVLHPGRDQYAAAGRRRCSTTATRCAPTSPRVDYLQFTAARRCPTASPPSASRSSSTCCRSKRRERIRVRVQVPEPTTRPSRRLFDLYPGTEAMEREVYDMFGIVFDRPPRPHPHPDARGLGRPPAPQGLRRRPRSRCSSRERPNVHERSSTPSARATSPSRA